MYLQSRVVAEKDAEASDAVARITVKLSQLDAKFRGCEEVRRPGLTPMPAAIHALPLSAAGDGLE